MDAEDIERGPQVGMVYPTLESLKDAYKRHAIMKGFTVITSDSSKKGHAYTVYLQLSCDRGKKRGNQIKSKRIGCPAKLSASLKNGSWVVISRHVPHTHELQPKLTGMMPSQRNLTIELQRELESHDIAGLRPSRSIRLLQVQSGGPENLGCLPKDCRNFVDQRRRLRLGEGDASAVSKLFLDLQTKDPNFFYRLETDNDGRLKSLLWIHPRAKAAFGDFNDAVCFDTTYLVNRYKMPFATFVGINHHGQSIILGCALVCNEDIASFRWMFNTWKDAMGREPRAMLTDQCECIRAAIEEVFPNTAHRFCLWHIMSKVPDKFKNVPDYQNATSAFKSIVYDSLSVEEFERKWNDFVQNRSLQSNQWLTRLYTEREKWVPIMLRHIFWAGMLSTQRSESMHAFYDAYVNSMCTLKQFVEKHEIAVADKIQKELRAEFDSRHKILACASLYEFERQYQETFTNEMFKRVKHQIWKMMYCSQIHTDEDAQIHNGVQKLKILDRDPENSLHSEVEFTVEYRLDGEHFACSCMHFEFCGYPCTHIFTALACLNVSRIHERYIMDRWRKDKYRQHTMTMFRGGYPHMTAEYRKYREMEHDFQDSAEMCMESPDKQSHMKEALSSLRRELLEWPEQAIAEAVNRPHRQHQNGRGIRDPLAVRSRGRPRLNTWRRVNYRRRRARGNGGSQGGDGSGNTVHGGNQGGSSPNAGLGGGRGSGGITPEIPSSGNAELGGGPGSGGITSEMPEYVENEADLVDITVVADFE